jgi:cation transporter-like permease
MGRLRSILFAGFTLGLISSISILGGLGLEAIGPKIITLIPLIIALPALNDMVGDYGTIIAAHFGEPGQRRRTQHQLVRAVFRVVRLNILAILVLSLVTAAWRGYAASPGFIIRFAVFIALAATIIIGALFGLNAFLDRALKRQHLNPDNFLIPVSTALGDVLMLGLVTLAVFLIF